LTKKTIKQSNQAETLDPPQYFDGDTFIPALLGEELMREYRFATMIDNRETYVYHEGYYQSKGELLISRLCRDRLRGAFRRNRVLEVVEYVKASTYMNRREESPNLIAVGNGVIDLEKMELRENTPDFMFFNKTPVSYDPAAKCPGIRKFLGEIVNGEDEVAVLEEVIGYCLYREYFTAKALMLVGEGSNGKSTYLKLVRCFLGIENISGRALQELEDNRFAKADLHGRLANIYADLPDNSLIRTGIFKMLTGRDLISAEKKFRESLQFENYAKLLFSANKVPEALDDTNAFFRRWIIITFPKVFSGAGADPHILEKITTPEELSGLLNVALMRLREMLKRGSFSDSRTTEELRIEYKRKSSPVASFVMDCLESDSESHIPKKTIYTAFLAYCKRTKTPDTSESTFFKNLPRHIEFSEFRSIEKGNRVRELKGLRFKAEPAPEEPEAEFGSAPRQANLTESARKPTVKALKSIEAAPNTPGPDKPEEKHTCTRCNRVIEKEPVLIDHFWYCQACKLAIIKEKQGKKEALSREPE
jgi:putative DNA primase/helicase